MKQPKIQSLPLSIAGHIRRGFTLVELLVVIVIGLVILTIAVPAFQSMSYSSNQSLAVNALQAASQLARDTAVISGKDGAVIFVFDPQVGKVQIIPAVKVGVLRELNLSDGGNIGTFGETPYFDRDVFVPAAVGQTLEMPRFWNVRGYVTPGLMIDRDSTGVQAATWYTSQAYGGTNEADSIKNEDHWIFPESGFFLQDAQVAGGGLEGNLDQPNPGEPTARQTFMIRFDARTGVVSRDSNAALFVNPRNSRYRPFGEPPFGDRPSQTEMPLRVDLAEDIEVWASRVVEAGDLDGNGFSFESGDFQLRQQLIGNASNDTILVKPVTRLALYDERKLAIGVGARGLNRDTNTIYQAVDQSDAGAEIEFDLTLFDGVNEEQLVERVNQWMSGNTTFVQPDGSVGDTDLNFEDEPLARLYMIQSYTGELQEILR